MTIEEAYQELLPLSKKNYVTVSKEFGSYVHDDEPWTSYTIFIDGILCVNMEHTPLEKAVEKSKTVFQWERQKELEDLRAKLARLEAQ